MREELIKDLRSGTGLPVLNRLMQEAANAIEEYKRDLNDCRNELCLKCGNYRDAHNGACDGCRWRESR